MKPPLLAYALLMAIAGPCEAEYIAGDLEEEFAIVRKASGRAAARRWYTRQVARSVCALLQLRIRSGEFTQAALMAGLGVAAPLLLLDRLWQFVYSQIPLKEGLERAPEFLLFNVLTACACAAILGASASSTSRAVAFALAAAVSVLLAAWVGAASASAGYVAGLALAVPGSALFTFAWRKSK
jgi:hypothetical protein